MSDRKPWELTDEEIEQAQSCGEYEYEDATPEEGQFIDEEAIAGGREVARAAQKKLVEYVLKWGRWEDSWHFILTKDKVDILKAALGVK